MQQTKEKKILCLGGHKTQYGPIIGGRVKMSAVLLRLGREREKGRGREQCLGRDSFLRS